MKLAPSLANENERLRALHDLLILDTSPEERFDRVVAFASEEFDIPTVLVSLVDANRQWFKASIGLPACETARDISFCGHAIASSELFVIEDALLDERFADNPLVTSAPFVRFYAGAPLVLATGLVVGTLCLIDTKPRTLDDVDRSILGMLRKLVVNELESLQTIVAFA